MAVKDVSKKVYTLNTKITFPEFDAPLRADNDFQYFDALADDCHRKGETPLTKLNIGIVTQIPLDYMHLSCLGNARLLGY